MDYLLTLIEQNYDQSQSSHDHSVILRVSQLLRDAI